MTDERELLKTQRARCEERVRGLKSYVRELTEMADRHGTDREHIEEDLWKARADVEFYESQAAEVPEARSWHAPFRAFHVYKDAAGEWRWRLVAGNGRIIAVSGEGYRDRGDCLHGVKLVKDSREVRVEDDD